MLFSRHKFKIVVLFRFIATLLMIPTPAKFGQSFFKQADDFGGAVNVWEKGQQDVIY